VYEGSFFPISLPTFVGGGVFDDSYSNGVKWNLSVVLISISFMAKDGEYFFMCFLAIWISSSENFLFSSVAYFFIGSLIFRVFSFLSSLYILVISLLSDV
jgi:hypothetical protein